MPTFEAACPECGHYDTYVSTIEDRNITPICKICQTQMEKVIFTAPAVRPDIHSWSDENNGKGRYITQLQRTMGSKIDENAYCKSQQDAINKAEAMGHKIEKTR